MAPRPAPLVQVRERLAGYRSRGLGFEESWAMATTGIQWQNGPHRAQWLPIIEETREGWRNCFERTAASEREAAFAVLGEAP